MPDLPELAYNADGLVPCIVQDADSREVLMMAWMNEQSLRLTLEQRTTWFWSRSRQELWHKGATSGNTQRLAELRYDCDADALLALVHPAGPACHTGERSCFYRVSAVRPQHARLSAGAPEPPAARPSEAGMRPKQAHTLRRHGRRTLRLHYKST